MKDLNPQQIARVKAGKLKQPVLTAVVFISVLFALMSPAKLQAQTITAGKASGYITACTGTASSSPAIEQFTVSGSGLTANITAAAPAGFEVSLSAGSGYSGSVSLTETGGTVAGTLVYVRSAASDAAGNISGNVVLSSAGATSQNVAVAGTVFALPTVNT